MVTQIGTNINTAVHLLNANELVAIPTETVYGLAANALEASAVTKIFEAKNRPFFNPLIIHLAQVEAINNYAFVNDLSLQLASHFMPGAFTLLLPKKNNVPDIVTAGSTKVAVRIPNHTITHQLLLQLNYPLAAPSANAFGYVSPVTAKHVWQGLQGKIPYILDGGSCSVGVESTIVEVEDNEVILHRAGGVAIEEIETLINKKLLIATHQNKPKTSGQLKSHYATTTPLIQGNINQLLHNFLCKKVAIISFATEYSNVPKEHQYILSKNKNLAEAAQHLFTTMRMIDEMDYDIILAEIFPNIGLGMAINDRLQRAQASEKE